MILVFFVSAIGHEVVVGVPLHMMRGWAFLGIMLQVRQEWEGRQAMLQKQSVGESEARRVFVT